MTTVLRSLCPAVCCIFIVNPLHSQASGEPRQTPEAVKPLLDEQGDALPDGAIRRLGSTRYRFGGNVTTAALSPDGKTLAIGTGMDFVVLADAASGRETGKIRIPGGFGIQNVVFSPDGKALAILGYGPGIRLVEVPSGKQIAQVQPQNQQNMRAAWLVFAGDGKTVSGSIENFNQNKFSVHVWEAASGKETAKVEVVQNNQIKSALSHDGALLATWGYYNPRPNELMNANGNTPEHGRTIQIWQVKDAKEIHKIKLDRQNISHVAFAPDSKTFAVASGVASFHIIETASGKELRKFAGRRGQVSHLAYTNDGKTLVAGGMDGTVQSWEAKTGKRLSLSEGAPWIRLFSLALPKTGEILALTSQGQALELREAVAGKSLAPMLGHHYWVRSLAFAADGKTLVSAGADGKICWWDVATGKETRTLAVRDDGYSPYGGYTSGYTPYSGHNGFPGRIGMSAISGNGRFLATGNEYGMNSVRMWDLTTGKAMCDFDAVRNNGPSSFAFSPDGSRLAALGNNGVLLWDVTSGEELPTLPFKRDPKMNNNMGGSNGGSLAFSLNGKRLAAAHNYYERNTGQQYSEVYLWQVEGAKEVRKIDKAFYNMGSLAFSPDGETLAIPMQDRTVLLVKGSTGKEAGRLDAGNNNFFQTLVFSPDGRTLAAGLNNTISYPAGSMQPNQKVRVAIWEIASSQIRREFTGHQNTIGALAFSPDGKTLASGSFDTTILLWDLTGAASDKLSSMGAEDLERIWADLSQKDAKTPYEGLVRMLAHAEPTLDFLRKNLTPAKASEVSVQEVDKLVGDLDAEKFLVRAKATKTLEHLGPVAAEALKNVLKGQPNLEQQRRIELLLEKLERAVLTSDELRAVRAVEALEKIGTQPARELLQTLSTGAAHAKLTQEAKTALDRLAH
ncbi:MAG: hypothetical protein HY040_17390 [Planctomycetes bacterium]|nr:hypothetical protein [Planctomycetota bacterium]